MQPLPREEVIKAVERKNPVRIPLVLSKFWGEGLVEQYGDRLKQLDRFPDDAAMLWIDPIDYRKMGLSWEINFEGARDRMNIVDDWSRLDEFIEKLPDPEQDAQFSRLAEQCEHHKQHNRYILFCWWGLFFERPWGIRGMENLLLDYYLEPENVHRLHDALCNLYIGYIRRAVRELQPDGFFTSDDLGHQTQPMMKPEIFCALLKPYYRKVGAELKTHNLHWWLHSCGNNTELLPHLIDVGVNVFHPLQKYTMDANAVAKQFGRQLSFLAGVDVQRIITRTDPQTIRAEVRFLIDVFDRPEGGMCIGAGNGIVAGTPFENIEAFLDEALHYGSYHRRQFSP